MIYAGVNGAPTEQGNQPAIKAAPRVGMVYSFNPQTVIRGGWGLYYSPWNYAAAGTDGWGQIGYSATTQINNPSTTATPPTTTMSNPFPAGVVQPTGNSLGLLTGVGGEIRFVDPTKGAPRVQQYSADLQRELPGNMSVSVGYTGLTGSNLSWGGSGNALININQLDPKYQAMGGNYTLETVPNPFFGVEGAGQLKDRATVERGQLLRPYPQFGNVMMLQSTGARSQYHAGIIQLRKRATGFWGGNFSYTYSRLTDNQFGESNYYTSAPGLQNNYTVVPDSPYYNPDQEYGRSLLDSPHKVVASPIIRLPFGNGQRWLQSGVGNLIAGGWTVSFVIQMQSGFPLGVSQNTNNTNLLGHGQRPNVVPGATVQVPGSITDRLRNNPADDLYLNPDAFTQAAQGTIGNSPRILEGVYSPWRNSTDMGLNKDFSLGGARRATLRLEMINVFNNPWYVALGSVSHGNTLFGRVNAQANYSRTMQVTARFTF
jgi:hypothetical protein